MMDLDKHTKHTSKQEVKISLLARPNYAIVLLEDSMAWGRFLAILKHFYLLCLMLSGTHHAVNHV